MARNFFQTSQIWIIFTPMKRAWKIHYNDVIKFMGIETNSDLWLNKYPKYAKIINQGTF